MNDKCYLLIRHSLFVAPNCSCQSYKDTLGIFSSRDKAKQEIDKLIQDHKESGYETTSNEDEWIAYLMNGDIRYFYKIKEHILDQLVERFT